MTIVEKVRELCSGVPAKKSETSRATTIVERVAEICSGSSTHAKKALEPRIKVSHARIRELVAEAVARELKATK